MAVITITIPDTLIQDILDSFVTVYGLPDGVTKAQNAKSHLKDYLREVYKQAKYKQVEQQYAADLQTARTNAGTTADTNSSVITIE